MKKVDLELPKAKKELFNLLQNKDSLLNDKISWKTLLSKLNFHLIAVENCHDYHTDGVLHSVYIQYYSSILTEYYLHHPMGDDRSHKYLVAPKIGLDIDEVLADWVTSWIEYYDLKRPTTWYLDRFIVKRFEEMKSKGILDDFYLSLKPKIKPEEIPFEPICYITSRPVDTEVTKKWLEKHGFPMRDVHTVGYNESKIDIAKKAGVEVFVDDRYDNFVEFNKNNICCYLMDAPHNQRYNVGFKRIKSLKELACIPSM